MSESLVGHHVVGFHILGLMALDVACLAEQVGVLSWCSSIMSILSWPKRRIQEYVLYAYGSIS
jgi:hypothetical protein